MEKGKVVDAIPAAGGRISKYGINWDNMAYTAKLTGKPVLAGENISNSRVKSLRAYKRPPFVDDDGHIAVHLRNSSIKADGKRYGDVYFEWVPDEQ